MQPEGPTLTDPRPGPERAGRLLHASMRIQLSPALIRRTRSDGSLLLLGGSPVTALVLRSGTAAVLDELDAGAPIGSAAHRTSRSQRSVEQLARRLLDTGMAEPVADDAGPHPVSDVTAVIPAREEGAGIGRLVNALRSRGIAVVVVDDGSGDDTAAAAARAGARVLRHPRSLGPAAARNSGIEVVESPLVLFVDADITLPEQCSLDPLLSAFADPRVVAAAPRVSTPPPHDEGHHALHAYEARNSPLDLGPERCAVRPGAPVSYVPTALLLCSAAAVRAAGGFDARMRTGEDVDLVWRLHRAGGVIRYEPSSRVWHRPRPTLGSAARQRHGYGRSAALLHERHPGDVAPFVASGWSVAVWALGLFGGIPGLIGSGALAGWTGVALDRKFRQTMGLADPKLAWTFVRRGHLGVGRQLATATRRAWLPLLVVASFGSTRARRALVACLAQAAFTQAWPRRAESRSVRELLAFTLLRLGDDAAYCSGVWTGCLHARSLGALRPRLVDWPGRSQPGRVQ